MSERMAVVIDYTNWRGVRASRMIRPVQGGITFGTTEQHKEAQWLMAAYDLDRPDKPIRQFALINIHRWRDAK